MQIDWLRIFIDVSHTTSFAQSAARLNLDPSQVSRAIRSLEKAIDCRLLQRTTRRMRLTSAGERFLPHAHQCVEAIERGREAALASQNEPEGRVRVTASVAFGETMIIPRLRGLSTRYPKLKVELDLRDQTVDLMADGFDLAVRLGPALKGDIAARKLFVTQYGLYASPQFLRHSPDIAVPDDLANLPIIAQDLPGHRNRWRFRGVSNDVRTLEIKPHLLLSSALGVRQAALHHLGVALMADWLVEEAVHGGSLTQLLPAFQVSAGAEETAAWLVLPVTGQQTARVRAVADFFVSEFAG